MTTKEILIVGAIVIGGYLVYKSITKPTTAARQPGASTGGQAGNTGTLGSTLTGWSSLISGGANTVENTYNNLGNWWSQLTGGSSTPPPATTGGTP